MCASYIHEVIARGVKRILKGKAAYARRENAYSLHVKIIADRPVHVESPCDLFCELEKVHVNGATRWNVLVIESLVNILHNLLTCMERSGPESILLDRFAYI